MVKGEEGGLDGLDVCLRLQGENINADYSVLQDKSLLQSGLQKIHRLLYAIIYSVHMYVRYSRRRSPLGV